MYSGLSDGLTGISIHTSLGTSRNIGYIIPGIGEPTFFPVHGPDEVLSEVEVHTCSHTSHLAMTVSL